MTFSRLERSTTTGKSTSFDAKRKFARGFWFVLVATSICAFHWGGAFADEPSRQGGATIGSVDVDSGVPASFSNEAPFPNVEESFPSSFQVSEGTARATQNAGENFDLSAFDGETSSSGSQTQAGGETLATSLLTDAPRALLGPNGISTSLKTLLIMSLFTVAPAILLMTTSYARVSIVFAILRQALGLGQIPSNQVVAALSIFLTILIMFPVWSTIYGDSVEPYSKGEISGKAALEIGQKPLRDFLWKQIEKSGNTGVVAIFARYVPEVESAKTGDDVPWRALAPAFLLSELKTAFLIGFQIFLPFLIIDVVVSCVLVSAGMTMLPPTVVSLPFKLILFVLVDGWTLITGSLLSSFA